MELTHDVRLLRIDPITYACSDELASMYKLSPFVWREDDHLASGPHPDELSKHGIAFAASAIAEGDAIHLYYSIADRHTMRATVARS